MILRLTVLVLFSLSITTLAVVVPGAAPSSSPHTRTSENPETSSDEPEGPPRIFWEKNPRIVAYQLKRLSLQQLLRLESVLSDEDEKFIPGYEAWIDREGMGMERRARAATALAKLRSRDNAAELIAATQRLDAADEERGDVLHDLAHLLAARPREELARNLPALEMLATEAQRASTREIGWAARVIADGAVGAAFEKAAGTERSVVDLLRSIGLVHDASLREAFFEPARSIVVKTDSREAERAAALLAIASVPGREGEAFSILSASLLNGRDFGAAVSALARIPRESWPRGDESLTLARAIVSHVERTPARLRTQATILEAAQLGRDLATRLPAPAASEIRSALDALGVRVVFLKTVPHKMIYDRSWFAIEAGKPVEIVLENPDIMPHNLVIVRPGAVAEVGLAAEAMLAPRPGEGLPYVPDSDQVLHATSLVEPNGRVALAFTAPTEPGEYPFVCTFPGHWRRMYGVIVVVEDLEAFLANPVEPADPLGSTRKLVEEWTTEKLLPGLEKVGHGQALERGRALFTEAGCVACHRVGKEGGAVGPDLTQVTERMREKGGRAALLRELIEPSAVVDAKYQQFFVQTTDGRALTGLVTAEDASTVSLVTNPSNPVPEVFPRSAIAVKVAAQGSVMPQGLLDRFHADEILEILAYLESGGDARHEVYRNAASPTHEHEH